MPAVPLGGRDCRLRGSDGWSRVESGSVGWQVTVWPFWFRNGVHWSSVLFWLLMTVIGVVAPVHDEEAPLIGACDGIDRDTCPTE